MHTSAMENGRRFFEVYAQHKESGLVADIGSQDVNGTLKTVMPDRFTYLGLDAQKANNVDIVLDDTYQLPLEPDSVDILVSSSCLEHSEFFWLTFLEMVRVTKPDGLIYLNIPSSGEYHAYPVDCWRFRLDAAKALMNWANREGYRVALLEGYTDPNPPWQDLVCVFVKDERFAHQYPDRISA